MKRFLLLLFVMTNLAANGQQLFNEQSLIDNFKYLSSDALEGRKPETKGSETARDVRPTPRNAYLRPRIHMMTPNTIRAIAMLMK